MSNPLYYKGPKEPVYRCGKCAKYPGRHELCHYNTSTDAQYVPVKAESYACKNFRRS